MAVARLAFIGVRGGHYESVLRALPQLPAVRVVGLCDGGAEPITALVHWCARNGHSPAVFESHEQLLDESAPDAVIVCGPFEAHASMAIDAIRRGVHVLTEKPAALTIDDLHRLRDTHRQRPDVHLAAMHTARFSRGLFTAWTLIRTGAIGDVRMINARKSYKLARRASFYEDRATYGGTIPWVGSHAIDWVLWLGGHRVHAVYAGHSAAHNGGHGTMERAALCHFTLCGGRFASVSLDLFRPSQARTHGDDWARVVGTDGVLEVTPDRVVLTNADHDGTQPQPLLTPPTMFEDFVAHIEGRHPSINTAADLLATNAACLLARESADDGRAMEAEAFTDIPMKSPKPAVESAAPSSISAVI